MDYVNRLNSSSVQAGVHAKTQESLGKDHTLSYLVAFAAVGLLFSILSTAFSPPDWPLETAPVGLDILRVETPAALPSPTTSRLDQRADP